MSGDAIIVKAIKDNVPTCRDNNPRNCIKPVNQPGSKVRAIEINIHSKETVSFTTYDATGTPVDIEPAFSIKVLAQKEPALIDANIEIKPDAPANDLLKFCKLNNSQACLVLGTGLLKEKKEKEAISLLTRACKLKSIDSCKILSSFYFNQKNKVLFQKYIQTACALKDQKSCSQLGLAQMNDGKTNQAVITLLEACKSSAEGCFLLGELFSKENLKESLRAYIKGCNFPNGASLCYLSASILDKISNDQKNFPSSGFQYELTLDSAYQIACSKGYQKACGKVPSNDLNKLKQEIFAEFNLRP